MDRNIQYCFLAEKTPRLKPIKFFLFFLLLLYHIFFYTMDIYHNELFDPIIKTEGKKTDESLSTPQLIDNDLEQLKQKINNDCQYYSHQINKIRKKALDYFQQNCGLNPQNWKKFIQEIEKIPAHTNYFTPPPFSFQQYITPNIASAPLKSLENNCIKNGICFKKMHVRQSSEISDFCLYTPFYASLQSPNGFTFLPDELKLNPIQYNHHPHFLNICIIAALKEDIARIHYLFDLAYQYQLGRFRYSSTECIPYFEYTNLLHQTNASLTFFILNRLRTGILHLMLRHKGVAQIVNNYLKTNPGICNRYGITKEDLPFLDAMIHIDSLKLYVQQPKKLKTRKPEELENSKKSDNDPFVLTEPYSYPYDPDDIIHSYFND